MDPEYVKQLEEENELLRRKIEMNPTLAEILGKYFTLSKEINRQGKESYSIDLSPILLTKNDYDYLLSVGLPVEDIHVEEHSESLKVGNDEDVKKLIEDYYNGVNVPKYIIDELNESVDFHKFG